jgi:isocitrate/isopropylmalate dehydrogenase
MPAQGAKRVAVIPGDDAAPEATAATLTVLHAMDLPLDLHVLPDGAELARVERGARERLVRAAIDGADTVLFGATSGTTGAVFYLRWGKDTYANVRPIKWRAGVSSPLRHPEGVDYVIVRENLEDLYVGVEGDLDDLRSSGLDLRPFSGRVGVTPRWAAEEGCFAVKVVTRANTERVARFAGSLARTRVASGRVGKITCATKRNVLWKTDGLFAQIVRSVVAEEFPDLSYEEYLADDLARRLVAEPADLDVVLLPNLFGDLLSDEGAATVGGLGLVPSGCFGDEFAYFEPVHGTAPDIAGQHVINPTATLMSAAMLLDHVGLGDDARRLERAVDGVLNAGEDLTPDLGGSSTTERFADAVRSGLE